MSPLEIAGMVLGTRFLGAMEERARFAALAEEMLVRAGARFVTVAGDRGAREAAARAAIAALAG